jgi:XTP/dITP diphosphohydrolase
MRLVFATNNKNKVYEVSKLITGRIKLLGLDDIHCTDELPETQPTLEGNALQKARYVYEHFKCDCFADDTGLEIEGLDGRPGVISARYAGEGKRAEDNMNKVLAEMSGMKNRKAKFRTVIALILEGKEYLFEGAVQGSILEKKQGEKGFGYDPIFSPDGEDGLSFAEMSIEKKNEISHRARAVKKLVEFLNTRYP